MSLKEPKWKSIGGPDVVEGELRIYGGSDDLTEIEGWLQDELPEDTPIRIGGLLIVRMVFGNLGWEAVIRQNDDDRPLPWKVEVLFEGYSPVVVVHCPLGTSVETLRPEDDN